MGKARHLTGILLLAACGGSQSDGSPPTVEGGNAYASNTPGQMQPMPGQAPTYGQQQQPYGAMPQGQAPAPTVTAATPPPSPLAPACTEATQIVCGGHRCNAPTGRCAMPCGSAMDCQPGFTCLGAGGPTAICVPGT